MYPYPSAIRNAFERSYELRLYPETLDSNPAVVSNYNLRLPELGPKIYVHASGMGESLHLDYLIADFIRVRLLGGHTRQFVYFAGKTPFDERSKSRSSQFPGRNSFPVYMLPY